MSWTADEMRDYQRTVVRRQQAERPQQQPADESYFVAAEFLDGLATADETGT